MLGQKLIDGIIREPLGGAHTDPWNACFATVKAEILKNLSQLRALKSNSSRTFVANRINKFCSMGVVIEN